MEERTITSRWQRVIGSLQASGSGAMTITVGPLEEKTKDGHLLQSCGMTHRGASKGGFRRICCLNPCKRQSQGHISPFILGCQIKMMQDGRRNTM